MSYYLKYRPQTVAELDIQSVRQAFERILRSGEFSHAYLFTGPKGTGKTSGARILAKILNCEKNRKQLEANKSLNEPCGKCEGCVSVMRGNNLGVMEMDAASNRGIDEIRVLRERIGLAPARGLFNVYVIDEVHMLTTEAFNALLKTLEEPPAHAIFVLCTTELQKVPATVVSRCTQITFTRATADETRRSLERVIKGEGLTLEEAAFQALMARTEGSFRDAMKLLEQAVQESKTVKAEMIDTLTGYTMAYEPTAIVEGLLAYEAKKCLEILMEKEQQGVDFSVFGARLVQAVRDLLLQAVMVGEREKILELTKLAERLNQAAGQIKGAVVPALPLEIAVCEWGFGEGKVAQVAQVAKIVEIAKVAQVVKGGEELKLEEIQAKWAEVMKTVKPLNHSLEALLRAAKPVKAEADWLTVEVFYAFHKEQLEQERHRRMVEEALSRVINKPVKIKFLLGKKGDRVKSPTAKAVVNVTGKVEDEELAKAAEEIFS